MSAMHLLQYHCWYSYIHWLEVLPFYFVTAMLDSLQRGVVSANADDQYRVTSVHERYYRTVVSASDGGVGGGG